jgi:ribosomal protein L37E
MNDFDMLWKCLHCTTVNKQTNKDCEVCALPNNINKEVVDKIKKDTEKIDEESLWRCGNCTYNNNIDDMNCSVCVLPFNTEVHETKIEEKKEDNKKWSCQKCTIVNDYKSNECSMCGYPKIATKESIDKFTDKRMKELSGSNSEEVRDPLPQYTERLFPDSDSFDGRGYSTGSSIDYHTGVDNVERLANKDKEKAIKERERKKKQIEETKWHNTFPFDFKKEEEVKKDEVKVEEVKVEEVKEEPSPKVEPVLSEQTKLLQQLALEREKRRAKK